MITKFMNVFGAKHTAVCRMPYAVCHREEHHG